ncbi:sigma-70 family RNA polymerase sigma factor [Asticcacaulis sp. 201]|uniref:RNA polymerase sigma factor n=1 Tax=Asticcacaulis sp. 201 TaxID=3028787 RepID=UPI0029162C03|nr:sigma-70 family RNA polymerase sigma factor [Asticcacaulis sp. 201]MDV6331181.1 sigma-70 family RNA polymerase sigma factor [Asticcacaulis sp. 201]
MTTPDASSLTPPTQSFDALVVRYRAPLRGYFRRQGITDDAEDLVQEVFIRLAQAHARMHWDNPDGYVFTIASNILTDHRRKGSRRGAGQHDELTEDLTAPGDTPERSLLNRDRLRQVVASLKTLHPNCYHSFILHRFENMPQAEIAKRLGLSVSTIEKHIMTALHHLNTTLGEEMA